MAGNLVEENWSGMGDHGLSKKARLLVEEEDNPAAAMEEEDNPAAAMEEKGAPVIGEDHSASGMETETKSEYDIVDLSFENIDEMGDSINYFTDTDDEHKPPKGDRSSHKPAMGDHAVMEEKGNAAAVEEKDKLVAMKEKDKLVAIKEKDRPAAMEEKETLVPLVGDGELDSDMESDTDDKYILPNGDSNPHNDIDVYDTNICSPSSFYIPRSLNDEVFYARAREVLNFAIEHINYETIRKVGKRYEFVSIEKAVETRSMSLLLTFKAKELDADNKDNNADAPVKILQTKVWAPTYQGFMFDEWRFKPDHAVMEEKEKLVWVSDEEFNSDTESDSDIEYIAPNPATHGYDAYMLAPGLPYVPQSLDSELFIARAHEVLEFAIGRINAETIPKDGKRYEFVSIEKGVESRTLSLLLTFKAKELDAENKDNNADAPVKILQTTVWAPPYAEFEFLEWRFKPGTT